MSKKLLSLLLVVTILIGCFSVGFSSIVSQARDVGVGAGAESFNPVKFSPAKDVLIGSEVNTTFNVEVTDKNYKVRINSITAYIPYYIEGGISYLNVVYTKGVVVSGAEAFTVTGSLTADVNSVVRYTVEYDILDKKDKTVWKNLTGYSYAFVSTNQATTGAVGTSHAYPGQLSDGCYFEVLDTLNTTYVQQSELQLLYKVRTQSAWNYRDPRTRGVGIISGNAPSTLAMMPDSSDGVTMSWPKCGAVYRSAGGDWLRMSEPESGYYNFTISFNIWGDDWEDQSNITETTTMYYIRSADKVNAINAANKYVKTTNTFADGYYVQKGKYTQDSWDKFVQALDIAYQVTYAIPNANYGYRLACLNAQSADEAVDAAFANLKEAEHDFYTYKDTVITPATCTEAGSEFCTCICGETKTNVIPATGHTRGAWTVVKAATCDSEGKEEVRCTVCNIVVEEKTTPKVAHVFETTTTSPTCTEQGYSTKVCTICGYTYTSDYVIPTGHSYNYYTVKPTCTEQGYTVNSCRNCAYVVTSNYTPARGHVYEATDVAPTCTEQGYTEYFCLYCDDSYTVNYIDALGHKPLDAVVENIVESTCSKEGSFDTVVYCEVCDGEISRVTTPVSTIAHTEGEKVEENRIEATDTTSGSYDEVVYCTVCGFELSRTTVVIPMTGGYFKEEDGSTTVIDRELGFIYGLDIGLDDIEDYVDYAENVTVSLSDGVGTGSVVTTYLAGEEWETFVIIIFGDLNGDGVVDIYDASILAAIVNGDMDLEEDSPVLFAADLNGDTVADIYDLAILNSVVNGETEIGQVPLG